MEALSGGVGSEESSLTSNVHAVLGTLSGFLHAREMGTTNPFYNCKKMVMNGVR